MVEKLAYVMANPVKAGLVAHARDWTGLTVLPHELGRRTLGVERPPVFFRADNSKWPDTVELTLTLPPAFAEAYRAEEVRKNANEELARQERQARAEVIATRGRLFSPPRVYSSSRCHSQVSRIRAARLFAYSTARVRSSFSTMSAMRASVSALNFFEAFATLVVDLRVLERLDYLREQLFLVLAAPLLVLHELRHSLRS